MLDNWIHADRPCSCTHHIAFAVLWILEPEATIVPLAVYQLMWSFPYTTAMTCHHEEFMLRKSALRAVVSLLVSAWQSFTALHASSNCKRMDSDSFSQCQKNLAGKSQKHGRNRKTVIRMRVDLCLIGPNKTEYHCKVLQVSKLQVRLGYH